MEKDEGNEAGDRDGARGASGAERVTTPPDEARQPRLPFLVVGIGASAGGLEAYMEFLRSCPPDAGMAYVLVQHLPPDRESLLAEILARHTRMPVAEAADGVEVERDRVYVTRPGRTLTIREGRLHLGAELAARGHGRPVDDFFRSLAEEQQQRAVGVVFSGMGTNGSAGAEAIRAVGGLVIAQDPESAQYPSMPRGLIDAHLSDFILRPSEVAGALIRYADQPYVSESAPPPARDEEALGEVLAVLRARTRHDFGGYRKPTLLRRVRRRMGLGRFDSMAEYARALRQTPAEATALADDLLIHVTGFFRDPEAWEALYRAVLLPLAEERPDGAVIRCWVSACATGEEAYSLAMLLVEAAEARGKRFDVKVFATDMAERALGAARAGVFPNGIESEVTPGRLARFFDRDDSFYRVRKALRELVVFAPQDVLQDPPFSRLDLVTCRNLLIYLEPETQRRVLALLHFSLRAGGVLMLGSSESVGLAEGDFEPIDRRHRIFRRVGPARTAALDLPALVTAARRIRPGLGSAPPPPAPRPAAQLASRLLLERHTPAAVVVDASGAIVHVHGDTSPYLALRSGSPTLDLAAMANDQVRGAARAALQRAAEAGAAAVARGGLIDASDGRLRVEVGATPLGPRGDDLFLVTFRGHPEPPPPPAGAAAPEGPLADQLRSARSELQGALEEMQASHEELKASHEEATSLNEELQSTNEELETSREEMQSLNEELVTVNAQLQAKMGELEATANDLGSLLTSTDIAVLFLDPGLRIRRYTPAVRDLIELIPSDVGRPFVDLRLKFADPDLLADARRVLDRSTSIERTVESEGGRHYLRRVLPYRTQDDRIDGVVVAFVDVTERREADEALRASEARLSALVRAGDNAVYSMSPDWGRMLLLEGSGFLAGTSRPTEAWLDANIPPEDRPQVRAAIERAIRERQPFELEHRVIRADGTVGWTHSRAVPLADAEGRIAEWFGVAGDVSARMEAQDALRRSEEKYRSLFEAIDEGFCIIEVLYEDGRPVDYRLLETNPAFERQAGIAGGAGRRIRELAPGLEAHWFETYARVAETGEAVRFQREAAPLGRHFDVYAFRVGAPGRWRVAVLFRDISERKRVEERQAFLLALGDALRPLSDPEAIQGEACRLLGEALQADRAFYVELDADEGAAFVGRDYRRAGGPSLAGRHPIEDFAWVAPSPRPGRTLAVPDVAAPPLAPEADRPATAAGRIGAHVTVPMVKDGRLVGALCVAEPGPRAWDPAEVALVEETAERIRAAAERSRAVAALREGEERFRTVVDLVPDLLWESRADGRTDWHNRRWLEYTGQAAEQAAGWGWADAIHPDDREANAASFFRGVQAGEFLRWECRIRRADGEYRWFLVQAVPVHPPAGEPRWYGAATDIHEVREAAQGLREAHDRLEQRVAERTAKLAQANAALRDGLAARRELMRRVVTAQEDERRRISRELHDGLGQELTALTLGLKALERSIGGDGPGRAMLNDVKAVVDRLGREAHDLAVELRPTALDDIGLDAALSAYIARWSERTGIAADFQLLGLEAGRLPPDVETAVYRVVQEALNNVAKHAGGRRVVVVAARHANELIALVEDEGRGFDPGRIVSGEGRTNLGILGMHERVGLVGGTLTIESVEGEGTVLRLRVPLAPSPKEDPDGT